MDPMNFVLQFARVLSSSTNPRNNSVQLDVGGIGSLDLNLTDEKDGEVGEQSEMFGGLGFVSKPLPPETIDGKTYACEAVCMRTSDGLVPVSYRDLRLNRHFPNVPPGRIGMVGYGGGSHTLDLTETNNGDQKTTIHHLYAPYDFNNGTPQKAMAVALDTTPGSENISMAIGGGSEGYQVSISEADGVQVRTPDSATLFSIKDDEITLIAAKITLQGNVYAGANTALATPLLAGPSSLPCPSLFLSPT